MLQKNVTLKNDADLDYAIHFKNKISILQNGEEIGRGIIQSYNVVKVTVEDGSYFRTHCQFKTI